jgi:hypothetical protein
MVDATNQGTPAGSQSFVAEIFKEHATRAKAELLDVVRLNIKCWCWDSATLSPNAHYLHITRYLLIDPLVIFMES